MKNFTFSLIVILLTIVTACPVFSQTKKTDANITGHLINTRNGEHIPFATIIVRDTKYGDVSDATGHFNIYNLPEGEYTVEAAVLGFETATKLITFKKNKTIEVNFNMTEDIFNMDDIVVTSNRTAVKRREAPALVNVVNAKLFEATSSNNVSEVLNFQTGLRVEQSCSNCGSTQLRINGLEGQYSQILLDSRAIFSSLSTVYGLEQLPAGMIERVEIIRGGGSALFGSNAIAGVVNIITKEPRENTFTLSNNTGYMGNGSFETNTTLNGSIVSKDQKTGVYLFAMNRLRDAYDRNDDGFSDIPAINGTTIGFRAFHNINDRVRLTAEYHHMNEYRRGGDSISRPAHESYISEQLQHYINGGSIKADFYSKDYSHQGNAYISVQGIDRTSYFGTDKNIDAYGRTDDITVVGGGQYVWNAKRLWFMPAQFTVGVEGNYNKLHDEQFGYGRDMHQTIRTLGGYAQNEWKNKKLSLLLGARVEKHNLVENVIVSPRANIRYTPIESLVTRISYANGYRAPQAYNEDLHIAAVGGEVSLIHLAKDLRPEYSNSVSASAEWTKKTGNWGELSVLGEGFYTKLNDIFVLVDQGKDANGNMILERQNASGATVTGFNFETQMEYFDHLWFQMGFTYQRSFYDEAVAWSDDSSVEATKNMLRTPDVYGYATINYFINENITLASSLNVTGPMYVPHYAGYITKDVMTESETFYDWSAQISYNFKLTRSFNMTVNAGVKNILDEFQTDIDRGMNKDAGYIYGPALPRMYMLGVKFFL